MIQSTEILVFRSFNLWKMFKDSSQVQYPWQQRLFIIFAFFYCWLLILVLKHPTKTKGILIISLLFRQSMITKQYRTSNITSHQSSGAICNSGVNSFSNKFFTRLLWLSIFVSLTSSSRFLRSIFQFPILQMTTELVCITLLSWFL